ncbi:Mak10 subunit, NatC N-terminal acetyltransferase-domain-containing protein, partial [Choanephora cucurbitarum]
MSAIEMMDPRMDTGMSTEPVDYNIHQRLSTLQALSMMDSLLIREMAWISGHSLSQTVYTCIYVHHLQQLNPLPMPTLTSSTEDMIYGIFRAYLLATEEDFTTNLFGLSFDHQNSDIAILNDLDAAIMLLNHLIHQSPADTLLTSLLNRVNLRKSFLLSLVYLSQSEGSHIPQARRELDRILEELKGVDLSQFEEVSNAFDPNISRKLTTQTPPRPHYFLHFAAQVPYPDAFSRSKLNTLFFHNQRIFGKIPVPQFMLQSIREIVQPPSWWLTNNPLPSQVNPVEFLEAHDTLKGFLERVSM